MTANPYRGEVDIELEGQQFILRPSYTAIIEAEKATGKSLVKLATAAGDGELSLTDTAIVITEMIKAQGKAANDMNLAGVNALRIGELIAEYGLMQTQLRLVIALTNAATGGCKADGTPKDYDPPGEAKATGRKGATPVAGSPASPAPRSAGRRKASGTQPRTSSGRPLKSGKK